MDAEERIALLERAEESMREASGLVREAMKGTEYEVLLETIERKIRNAVSSDDGSASISGIRLSFQHDADEHPIWTKPLKSPKNMNRRDI